MGPARSHSGRKQNRPGAHSRSNPQVFLGTFAFPDQPCPVGHFPGSEVLITHRTGRCLSLSPPPAYLPLVPRAQALLCSSTVLRVPKSLTKLGVAWARLNASCHTFLPAHPRPLLVSHSLTSPKPQQSPYHRTAAIVIRFCPQ